MAIALNPDAPIYLPTCSFYPLPCPYPMFPNPNPNFVNCNPFYPYPFYNMIHQTHYEKWLVHCYTPQPFAYYHHTFPCTDFPFFPQQFLPSAQNRCSIEELDGRFEAEVKNGVQESSGVLVRNSRVLRSNVGMNNRRYAKIRRAHLEINCEEDFDDRTTVMIKNIPSEITKNGLLSMLDKMCAEMNQHEGTSVDFDFFYLPVDFRTNGNYGYALVNFTSSCAVRKIHNSFHGYRWDYLGSDKIVKVNYAHIQGFSELVRRAKNLKLRRPIPIPDSFMPSLFQPPRNGLRFCTERLLGKRLII